MSNLTNHLNEFICTFFYILFSFCLTFLTSYIFAPQLIKVLSLPLSKYIKIGQYDFIFTNIFEVFDTYITLAFYNSLFLNLPLFLYLIYLFIKPGLFKYEKDFLVLILKTFSKFVFFSIIFTYYLVLPSILSFLLNLDLVINSSYVVLKMDTKLYDYVIFSCKLIFIYCFFIFQLPSVFIIFVYFQQPNLSFFYRKRRVFIVLSFIIGCIFSSPDLISLFIVSIPLIIFFECIVFTFILKDNYKNLK